MYDEHCTILFLHNGHFTFLFLPSNVLLLCSCWRIDMLALQDMYGTIITKTHRYEGNNYHKHCLDQHRGRRPKKPISYTVSFISAMHVYLRGNMARNSTANRIILHLLPEMENASYANCLEAFLAPLQWSVMFVRTEKWKKHLGPWEPFHPMLTNLI